MRNNGTSEEHIRLNRKYIRKKYDKNLKMTSFILFIYLFQL